MPELAEVEYVRKVTERHTLNKTISDVTVFEDEIVFVNKKGTEIKSSLMHSKVTKVCRKGKIFWIMFDSPPHISFHLGMTGRMMVKGHDILTYYRYPDCNKQNQWPPRFAKLVIAFNDHTEIAFTNTRRLGRVRLHHNEPQTEQPISKLGYDPYTSMCSLDEFTRLILKRKCPLKAALLNQSFTAGVGNWIADEVCYQSGVHPGVYCHTLHHVQIKRIYESLQSITKYAVSVDADYDQFPSNWLFHYRWNKGKKAKRKQKDDDDRKDYTPLHTDCFGNEIVYEQIGGRTTAIVLELQSKKNGYRVFDHSTQIGKIETVKETLKMNEKHALSYAWDGDGETDDNTNIKKKRKGKRKKDKKRKQRQVKKDKGEPQRKKRKIARKLGQKDYFPLIPVELLRRSARLASKQVKAT
eukprot:235010_1